MWFSFSSAFPQSNCLSALKPSSQSTTAQVILPSYVKSITSTTNPFVKHCVKLRNSSSYRHSHGSVLLVGTTPLSSLSTFYLIPRPGLDLEFSSATCLVTFFTQSSSADSITIQGVMLLVVPGYIGVAADDVSVCH
ncbi:tRNA/rRNA methyltransferase, SpoU family protein [Tanacetum coccineum]